MSIFPVMAKKEHCLDPETEFLSGLLELNYSAEIKTILPQLREAAQKVSWAQGWPECKKSFWNAEAFMWSHKIEKEKREMIRKELINFIDQSSCLPLDLGCGSANIAIAIKKAIGKDIRVFSSDVSLGALTVAKKNCLLHETNILLVNSNLFGGFKFKSFDLIISNPPYVAEGEIRGPLEYEPRIALAAGRDGLAFIKAILSQAHLYLRNNGYLIMEIGYSHKEALSRLLAKTDRYETIEWIKDYDGNCRGILLKNYKSQIPNSKQTPIAELQ